MYLCHFNHGLLRGDYQFIQELLAQAGSVDNFGETALIKSLLAEDLDDSVIELPIFQRIFEKEWEVLTITGLNTLMVVCKFKPQFLVEELGVFLVQQQCGMRDRCGETALMKLF